MSKNFSEEVFSLQKTFIEKNCRCKKFLFATNLLLWQKVPFSNKSVLRRWRFVSATNVVVAKNFFRDDFLFITKCFFSDAFLSSLNMLQCSKIFIGNRWRLILKKKKYLAPITLSLALFFFFMQNYCFIAKNLVNLYNVIHLECICNYLN